MSAEPDQETLMAISARIRRAEQLLETGRTDDARRVLAGLVAVLPMPLERHIRSADTEPTSPEVV